MLVTKENKRVCVGDPVEFLCGDPATVAGWVHPSADRPKGLVLLVVESQNMPVASSVERVSLAWA